jgi:hypothetical protein
MIFASYMLPACGGVYSTLVRIFRLCNYLSWDGISSFRIKGCLNIHGKNLKAPDFHDA